MGYCACMAAGEGPAAEGNVGAGMGCSVGKVLGLQRETKSGIGTASMDLGDGLLVGALVAVNAFGDIVDEAGKIMAGARALEGAGFADTLAVLATPAAKMGLSAVGATVIGVVATNARLTKEGANLVAQMAQDGLARAVRPAHTLFDGDTLFAMATGQIEASVTLVGAYAAEVVAMAIRRSILATIGAGGLPAASDLIPR